MSQRAALAAETRDRIDGKLVPASNGATLENVNSAPEEAIGVCTDGHPGRHGVGRENGGVGFEEFLEARVVALPRPR